MKIEIQLLNDDGDVLEYEDVLEIHDEVFAEQVFNQIREDIKGRYKE